MAVLPTNYLDDILAASMGGKRRFRITHEDGSTEEVTLEDVSEYEQVGSPFGSGDVNKTNQAVNEKLDSADVVDPALATVLGFAADAKLTGDALSELTKNLNMRYNVETDMVEIFYNGVWQEWTSAELQQYMIYNYGEEFRTLTLSGECTKGADNIRVGNENTSSGQLGVLHTNDKINLSRYKTLHIEGTFAQLNNTTMRAGFVNAKNSNDQISEFVGNYTSNQNGTIVGKWSSTKMTVDVSNLTGEYYLRVTGYRCRCIINKIYLT